MGIQIRVGTKADIHVLVEIIQDSFLDVAERFGLTPQNSPTHPSNCRPEWLLREMDRGVTFYMLENDGQPVGCVALEKISDEVCYLERLAVLPQERRKGFGEALVRHVLSKARLLDVCRVGIGIIAEHKELQNWYEKLGFEEVESKRFPQFIFPVTLMAYYF
ncbi:MAG TPA: GNAT family N-acetyltransferase [Smithellaceae bacterium]|nr:GNAT family N-acetyltransferase [Smithellaceae bacterium]HRY38197.1 GNAT family N-acetyltransferase [Smithellaceae bacterium]